MWVLPHVLFMLEFVSTLASLIRLVDLLTTPVHSAIRSHGQHCSADVSIENFSIIGSATGFDLRILDSLHILKLNPPLNDMQSSFPLSLVGS